MDDLQIMSWTARITEITDGTVLSAILQNTSDTDRDILLRSLSPSQLQRASRTVRNSLILGSAGASVFVADSPMVARMETILSQIEELNDEMMVNHMKKGAMAYDTKDSEDLSKDTFNASVTHLSIAFLMDALYKQRLSTLSSQELVDSIPDDADLIRLYKKAYNGEGFCDSTMENFSPNARETMRILMTDFDDFPQLNEIEPCHRWRLIVDPVKVDILARHGIDPNNPMLAYLFDSEKNYAFNLANGWIATAKALNDGRDLDLDLVKEICTASGGRDIAETTRGIEAFAAKYDDSGRLELAKFIDKCRDDFEFTYYVHTNNHFIMSAPVIKNRWAFIGGDESIPTAEIFLSGRAKAKQSDASLSELIGQASNGIATLRLGRAAPGREKLEAALRQLLNEYQDNAAKAQTESDRILASTTLYHDAENLHPFVDGNFRIFGKLILNFTLAQQGVALTELYDPNRTDGQSSIDNIEEVRKGQSWRRLFLRAPPR